MSDLTKYSVASLVELPAATLAMASQIKEPVLLFYGAMGAGKTTTIKSLCKALGVIDEVSSPTFSLVNEYATQDGSRVYHFDMYRIESEEEVYDMGYEEYFYSGDICLVEWPEKIPNLLPEKFGRITIEQKHQTREISVEPSCQKE